MAEPIIPPDLRKKLRRPVNSNVSANIMTTCYMCNQQATTLEHAPPKCIFPEKKDVPSGKDYRKDLITVSSCELHNTATSRDDEYLLYMLSASITSSDVGLNQFLTKVRRAAGRSPALASSMVVSSEPVKIFHEDTQEWKDAYGIQVQGHRLDLVFKKIAYALYFHEKQAQFDGEIKVVTGFTLYSEPSVNSAIASAVPAAEEYFSAHECKGSNPEVFFYRFEEGLNSAIMLMNFYGTSKVLIKYEPR